MTVGLSRPVNSASFEMSSATEMMGASAACASSLCLVTSSLYCSMYILWPRKLLSGPVACVCTPVPRQQALGCKGCCTSRTTTWILGVARRGVLATSGGNKPSVKHADAMLVQAQLVLRAQSYNL